MDNQPNLPPAAPAATKPNAVVAFLQKKRTWPTWAIIAALVVVFGLGRIGTGSGVTSTVTTTANVSTTAGAHGTTSGKTTTTTPPTATPAPKNTTIATYSGTTSKNTPNFHVNADQWTISWSCQGGQYGGNLTVSVYQSDGTSIDPVAVNVVCNGAMHDSTIERGSGDFYLTIDADVSWTITIQATQ